MSGSSNGKTKGKAREQEQQPPPARRARPLELEEADYSPLFGNEPAEPRESSSERRRSSRAPPMIEDVPEPSRSRRSFRSGSQEPRGASSTRSEPRFFIAEDEEDDEDEELDTLVRDVEQTMLQNPGDRARKLSQRSRDPSQVRISGETGTKSSRSQSGLGQLPPGVIAHLDENLDEIAQSMHFTDSEKAHARQILFQNEDLVGLVRDFIRNYGMTSTVAKTALKSAISNKVAVLVGGATRNQNNSDLNKLLGRLLAIMPHYKVHLDGQERVQARRMLLRSETMVKAFNTFLTECGLTDNSVDTVEFIRLVSKVAGFLSKWQEKKKSRTGGNGEEGQSRRPNHPKLDEFLSDLLNGADARVRSNALEKTQAKRMLYRDEDLIQEANNLLNIYGPTREARGTALGQGVVDRVDELVANWKETSEGGGGQDRPRQQNHPQLDDLLDSILQGTDDRLKTDDQVKAQAKQMLYRDEGLLRMGNNLLERYGFTRELMKTALGCAIADKVEELVVKWREGGGEQGESQQQNHPQLDDMLSSLLSGIEDLESDSQENTRAKRMLYRNENLLLMANELLNEYGFTHEGFREAVRTTTLARDIVAKVDNLVARRREWRDESGREQGSSDDEASQALEGYFEDIVQLVKNERKRRGEETAQVEHMLSRSREFISLVKEAIQSEENSEEEMDKRIDINIQKAIEILSAIREQGGEEHVPEQEENQEVLDNFNSIAILVNDELEDRGQDDVPVQAILRRIPRFMSLVREDMRKYHTSSEEERQTRTQRLISEALEMVSRVRKKAAEAQESEEKPTLGKFWRDLTDLLDIRIEFHEGEWDQARHILLRNSAYSTSVKDCFKKYITVAEANGQRELIVIVNRGIDLVLADRESRRAERREREAFEPRVGRPRSRSVRGSADREVRSDSQISRGGREWESVRHSSHSDEDDETAQKSKQEQGDRPLDNPIVVEILYAIVNDHVMTRLELTDEERDQMQKVLFETKRFTNLIFTIVKRYFIELKKQEPGQFSPIVREAKKLIAGVKVSTTMSEEEDMVGEGDFISPMTAFKIGNFNFYQTVKAHLARAEAMRNEKLAQERAENEALKREFEMKKERIRCVGEIIEGKMWFIPSGFKYKLANGEERDRAMCIREKNGEWRRAQLERYLEGVQGATLKATESFVNDGNFLAFYDVFNEQQNIELRKASEHLQVARKVLIEQSGGSPEGTPRGRSPLKSNTRDSAPSSSTDSVKSAYRIGERIPDRVYNRHSDRESESESESGSGSGSDSGSGSGTGSDPERSRGRVQDKEQAAAGSSSKKAA